MSELVDKLADLLAAPDRTWRVRGDHDLNPEFADAHSRLREAAVLALIVDTPPAPRLVLTQRTAHLSAHAGQISMPGGRLEPEDASLEVCALRETQEEIGVPPDAVSLIGRLDTYITRTGFRVTPVVGVAGEDLHYLRDAFEVDEVFEVPLAHFLAPDSLRTDERYLLGKTRRFFSFPYGDYYIWGATAGMLVNLRELLGVSC